MKSFMDIVRKQMLTEAKYWGHEAGGSVFYSHATGRILFVERSKDCDGGWSMVIGGKKEDTDPDIKITINREIQEEIGGSFHVISQTPLEIFIDADSSTGAGFKYFTYFTVVDNEFEPILNAEHDNYKWVDINHDILPEPLHFGTKMLINSVKRKIFS